VEKKATKKIPGERGTDAKKTILRTNWNQTKLVKLSLSGRGEEAAQKKTFRHVSGGGLSEGISQTKKTARENLNIASLFLAIYEFTPREKSPGGSLTKNSSEKSVRKIHLALNAKKEGPHEEQKGNTTSLKGEGKHVFSLSRTFCEGNSEGQTEYEASGG